MDLLNKDGKVVAVVAREGDELIFKTYLSSADGKNVSPSWVYKGGIFSMRLMIDHQFGGEAILDTDTMLLKASETPWPPATEKALPETP